MRHDEQRESVRVLKREAFLRRICEVAQGDSHRWVPVGIVGEQMGLPYEQALALTDELRDAGLVRRGGGGRLEPPLGPRVRITPKGVRHGRERQPEAEGYAA